MSGLDVEALLEASESSKPKQQPDRNNSASPTPKPERNGGGGGGGGGDGSVKSSSSRRDHDKDRNRDDRGERHRRRSRSSDRCVIPTNPYRLSVNSRRGGNLDAVGTPTMRTEMIIMIPHAIDIVHGKAGMTIDTIPDASAAIESTTTSAIGMITATDMSAPPGDRGAHASVAIVAAAGPGLGECIFERPSQSGSSTNGAHLEVVLRS